MIETFLTIIHVLVCISLIMIILLQTGKGAGMGAAFGGASQTLFGSTGKADFFSKFTIVAAIVFVITSISLSFVNQSSSVMSDYKDEPVGNNMPELPPDTPVGIPAPDTGGDVTPPTDDLPDLDEPPTETTPIPPVDSDEGIPDAVPDPPPAETP
jgi:preprotein translocase subunit SecG